MPSRAYFQAIPKHQRPGFAATDSPLMSAMLLQALASGERCGGPQLAQRNSVTRAAIWKQVQQLRNQGFPIITQGRLGYQSPWPIQLLDRDAILAGLLDDPAARPGTLDLYWKLDSTSSELLRRGLNIPDLSTVLAETQSAGRGRRGRPWLSPPGLNLYVSCFKRFERGFNALSGLSLAIGVILIEALRCLGIHDVGIKWPNDILAPQGKLAGILVELVGEYQGPCAAVIGVGLNLRLTPAMQQQLKQPATDLHALLPAAQTLDRNTCAAVLIQALCRGLRRFEAEAYPAFQSAYAQHDLLKNGVLQIQRADGQVLEGVGAGTDDRGALRLATPSGIEHIDSAEVTVRRL